MCFVFGAKLTILGAVAQVKIYYCLRLKFLVFDLKENFLKYISKALLFNCLVTLLDTLQEQFSLLMVAGKSTWIIKVLLRGSFIYVKCQNPTKEKQSDKQT